jgi:hypothetical protein
VAALFDQLGHLSLAGHLPLGEAGNLHAPVVLDYSQIVGILFEEVSDLLIVDL